MGENTKVTATTITAGGSNPAAKKALERKADLTIDIAEVSLNGVDGGGGAALQALPPKYPIKQLRLLLAESSSVPTCVDAYANNIALTGYDFVRRADAMKGDGSASDDPGALQAMTFCTQVYPGLSMTRLKSKIAREMYGVGLYYVEVLRNASGNITMLRGIKRDKVWPLRYVATDKTSKDVTLRRGNETVTLNNLSVYERRYASASSGGKATYYAEFGSKRYLNVETGVWGTAEGVPLNKRASELIAFGDEELDSDFVPRWVTEARSVIGEQEAAELNLAFFNAGGIPPAVFALIGGQVDKGSRERFDQVLSGRAADKVQAVLVEIFSTGGSFDKENPAKLEVHKFGADSQKDGMFASYLSDCESRIRRRFRLPPIFVGSSADMSYATAFVSYMIADEQVFQPERAKIDDIFNSTIFMEMWDGDYQIVSRPLKIRDTKQLQSAVEFAKTNKLIDGEEAIRVLNTLLAMDMKYDDEADEDDDAENATDSQGVDDSDPAGDGTSRTDVGNLTQQGAPAEAPRASSKADVAVDSILDVAERAAAALLATTPCDDDLAADLSTIVGNPEASRVFKRALTAAVLVKGVTAGAGTETLIVGDDGHGHNCA